MRGIVTVLNTPFRNDNSIDVDGLRQNVANALDVGVVGFLAPALAGEVNLLTFDEKRRLIEEIVAEVRGRVPVIGGAAARRPAERLGLSRMYADLGCSGVLVQLSAQDDPLQIERELLQLDRMGFGQLMVQDWDPDGFGLSLDLIQRLCDRVAGFNWLKIEVQNAGPKYTQVLTTLEGRLSVAGGWAVTEMIDGLNRGVHAFMPTGMHLIYTEIYRRFAAGEQASAARLFEKIAPILQFSNQHLDVSIRFFKRLLHREGIFQTSKVRIDSPPWDIDNERIADEWITKVIEIEEEIRQPRSDQ